MSAPERPAPTPDQLPGRIHTHEVEGARRRMYLWLGGAAVLLVPYAFVTFERMLEIAKRLPGWPRGFPTGAALLFTALTIFALVLLTVWATRRSRLRGALQATGRISEDTHGMIASLGQAAEGYCEQSRTQADAAGDELNQGLRWRDVGREKVVRVAQKSAVLAGVKHLVVPDPANLGSFHQDERDHAEAYLHTATSHRSNTANLLNQSPDFSVSTPLANPWLVRTADRSTAPNPEFVDQSRVSGRHGKAGAGVIWKVLAAIAILALIAMAVFMATHASASPSSAPTPSVTTSAASPPGSSPPSSTYSFIDKVNGAPVHWACTSPITVHLNGSTPAGASALLTKVISNVKAAANLPLQTGSATNGSPTTIWPGVIEVSYMSHQQFNDATGGASAVDAVGDTQIEYGENGLITGAWIAIDRDDPSTAISATDGYTVLAHEMGHAVGLGHAEDDHEVMYPHVNGQTSWGVGDRYALRTVGCR